MRKFESETREAWSAHTNVCEYWVKCINIGTFCIGNSVSF